MGRNQGKTMLKWMCLSNSGCFRTALVVTTSHEADMEEDNLRLQEELEKVKAEVWKAYPYRNKSWGG